MRPLDNPYIAGAGSPPPLLAGRDDILAAVELMLGRAQIGRHFRNPLFIGLRGAGKTVTLARVEELANAARWVVAGREISSDRAERFRETMTTLARKAILAMSHQSALGDDGIHLLRVLASFAGAPMRADASAGPETEVAPLVGIADSGSLDEDLADLFLALGEVARAHDGGVIFLFDEIQNLGREDFAALVDALHRASAKALPVAVAVAGLTQPSLPSAESQTRFEQLFETWPLGSLEAADAGIALAGPAQAVDADWTAEALAAAIAASEGWPYFLQEWGQRAWSAAESSPIGLADVEAAGSTVLASLDRAFFAPRYERATEAERAYLAAMASLGEGSCDTAAVAAALGATQQGVSVRRDGLLRKGLIYSPRLGQVAFAAPGFAAFLGRRENLDNTACDSRFGHLYDEYADNSALDGAQNRVDSDVVLPSLDGPVTHASPLATTAASSIASIQATRGLGPKDPA